MSDISRPAYLNRIVPFFDKPLIKVLTGVGDEGLSGVDKGDMIDDGKCLVRTTRPYRRGSMQVCR